MSNLPTDLSSVTTVAVDLAKHVFQVHATDAGGNVLVAKALRRRDVLPFFASLPPCLVGDADNRLLCTALRMNPAT